jgi:uncharacterized Zn finger protein (UPF0148 family)
MKQETMYKSPCKKCGNTLFLKVDGKWKCGECSNRPVASDTDTTELWIPDNYQQDSEETRILSSVTYSKYRRVIDAKPWANDAEKFREFWQDEATFRQRIEMELRQKHGFDEHMDLEELIFALESRIVASADATDECITCKYSGIDEKQYSAYGCPECICAEINARHCQVHNEPVVSPTTASYVPQDVAMECLKILAPLDVPGEPNTLLALVTKAMKRGDAYREALEKSSAALHEIGERCRDHDSPAAKDADDVADDIDSLVAQYDTTGEKK